MRKKIKYNPELSIEEMAHAAGAKISTVRRYIRDRKIDRNFERKLRMFNKIQAFIKENGKDNMSILMMAQKCGVSVNTFRKYSDPGKKPQKELNGKISTLGKQQNPATLMTVSDKEDVILNSILTLYCGGAETFDCDLTFGDGGFYKYIPRPRACYDKFPNHPDVVDLNVVLGLMTLFDSVVCDLPHYIDKEGEASPDRFSSIEDAYLHHGRMLQIAHDILKNNGILVYKTTDYVVNGRQEWISDYVIRQARDLGFELIDKFIYIVPKRLMRRHSNQNFATKNHAFFLVFRKPTRT